MKVALEKMASAGCGISIPHFDCLGVKGLISRGSFTGKSQTLVVCSGHCAAVSVRRSLCGGLCVKKAAKEAEAL